MVFKSEEELNEAIQEAKASLAIESMIITKEMEKLLKRR